MHLVICSPCISGNRNLDTCPNTHTCRYIYIYIYIYIDREIYEFRRIDPSEIWQAWRQQRLLNFKRCDHVNKQSCCFETSRRIVIRRLVQRGIKGSYHSQTYIILRSWQVPRHGIHSSSTAYLEWWGPSFIRNFCSWVICCHGMLFDFVHLTQSGRDKMVDTLHMTFSYPLFHIKSLAVTSKHGASTAAHSL